MRDLSIFQMFSRKIVLGSSWKPQKPKYPVIQDIPILMKLLVALSELVAIKSLVF
jgi:hypothetical protein